MSLIKATERRRAIRFIVPYRPRRHKSGCHGRFQILPNSRPLAKCREIRENLNGRPAPEIHAFKDTWANLDQSKHERIKAI